MWKNTLMFKPVIYAYSAPCRWTSITVYSWGVWLWAASRRRSEVKHISPSIYGRRECLCFMCVCVSSGLSPDPSDSLLCNNYSSRAGNGNTLFLGHFEWIAHLLDHCHLSVISFCKEGIRCCLTRFWPSPFCKHFHTGLRTSVLCSLSCKPLRRFLLHIPWNVCLMFWHGF